MIHKAKLQRETVLGKKCFLMFSFFIIMLKNQYFQNWASFKDAYFSLENKIYKSNVLECRTHRKNTNV